jgi:lipooligosaccharide transport system ATP-binding protein
MSQAHPAGAAAPLLEARGLVKHLGGRRVVDGVDLACREGEILGLLGPNGAGKTTTLRMLYGFLTADAGSIAFRGDEVSGDIGRAKRWIGVCTQDDTFDGDFTVEQNLRIAATYFRPRPPRLRARVADLLDRFDLSPYARAKPETLSGGYRRRLMIARALVHEPRLLFLDEPTTGLDPQARMAVWDLVSGLRRDGLGIVLTTHYMDEAERLSDGLAVLSRGRVVARGTPRAVLGDLVGEHVLVVESAGPAAGGVLAWLAARKLGEPVGVLGAWHIPLSAPDLADFARAFPALRYEVRPPSLDDLFLKLAVT